MPPFGEPGSVRLVSRMRNGGGEEAEEFHDLVKSNLVALSLALFRIRIYVKRAHEFKKRDSVASLECCIFRECFFVCFE